MMRRGVLLAAALAATITAAGAQDLAPRRGFSVTITTPKTDTVVLGRAPIEAEVEIDAAEDLDRVEFFVDDELIFIDREPPFVVEYDFGVAREVHVVRVVAHHVDGPTVSDFSITRSLDPSHFVNVQRVILDVSVRDRRGRPVLGLPAEAFHVTEEGRAQRIKSVSTETRPILVAVLVDSSGSMRERIEQAQDAACAFVETLGPEDRALVIDFDEAVYLIEPPTSDHEALCASIRSTEPVGGTALYEAIHAAFRVLNRTPAERRAMVILSDGEDTESSIPFDVAREDAELSEVTIYAIGLDVPPLGGARKALKGLADETGGRAYFVSRASELAGVYQNIAEELKTLYQVVYASDNEVFDGRYIPIRVEVDGDDLEVRHRRGYRAVEP